MKAPVSLLAASLALITISCTKKSYPQLEKADWLIGEWGHTIPEGRFVEIWQSANDSAYRGQSYFIQGNDTTFAEYIDLVEDRGTLKYIVSVKGENAEKPVPFKLTSALNAQLVFENPQHDFPDRIIYKKITNDSIVAEITGLQNGRDAVEVFPMKKKK